MSRRRLPIGIQTFRTLREQDCYYVDKTTYLERLINEGTHLLSVAAAAVRQEPVPGHAEGVLRGQRGAVRRAAHPSPARLVAAPPGGATELRQRHLQGAGVAATGRDGATGRPRAGQRGPGAVRHRIGAFSTSSAGSAPADGATGEERLGDEALYRLGYPNREVRQSLNRVLLSQLVLDVKQQIANSTRLARLLAAHDCAGLQELFQAFFASIPYQRYAADG